MNGRVYDPLVGRFMSGDPLVQDPVNGQNYNRYSYVLNNPTNLTDPTGFAGCDVRGMLTSCGGGDWRQVGSQLTNGEIAMANKVLGNQSGPQSNQTQSTNKSQSLEGVNQVNGKNKEATNTVRDFYDNPGLAGIANSVKAAERRSSYWGAFFGGDYSVMDPDGLRGHENGKTVGIAADIASLVPAVRGVLTLRAASVAVGVGEANNVANASNLLLGAPRQLEAAWGASTYRHGGLMSSIEHVWYRHAPNSGFANVSHFAEGTRLGDISRYVDSALRYGKVNSNGLNAYTVEYNLGRRIGTDISGNATSNIRVHVRGGIIQTAFPF